MLIDGVLLWLGLPKLTHFPLEKKTLEKFLFSEYRHFMLEP